MSVAQKMSWATHRQTTRAEDTAYCLLGIFEISMPLLYGEEGRAFKRLQEEILRSVHDLSIFACERPRPRNMGPEQTEAREYCGVLAESPFVVWQLRDLQQEAQSHPAATHPAVASRRGCSCSSS